MDGAATRPAASTHPEGSRVAGAQLRRAAPGDRRLDELDRRLLERTYAHLLAAGGKDRRPLAPGSVCNVHVMLRTALKDACQAGWLESNPAEKARPPRPDPGDVELRDDPQVWTAEQAATFLRGVDEHPWRALWHLAIGTGARRGELVGLRWTDVRLETARSASAGR